MGWHMKTSGGTRGFRSIVGKVTMGLVLAAMIGSLDVATAIARDEHRHGGGHHESHRGYRVRGHDRGRHHGRYLRSHAYGYREPVYVTQPAYYAPPVYYAPQAPAPGINIFLPFH